MGVNRTGSGIPTAGFPLGSGFTHYRWRLDDAAWSAETPIDSPIELMGLAAGSHHVEVIGKNDAGWYQNDPLLGEDAVVTMSRAWTVDPSYLRLVINEVLAVNESASEHEGTLPGMVELYYDGAAPFDLSDMYLTNGAATPARFTFPAGSVIEPGQYLVLLRRRQRRDLRHSPRFCPERRRRRALPVQPARRIGGLDRIRRGNWRICPSVELATRMRGV